MPSNGNCEVCIDSYDLKIGRKMHLSGNFTLALSEWEQEVSLESHRDRQFSREGHSHHVTKQSLLTQTMCVCKVGSETTEKALPC